MNKPTSELVAEIVMATMSNPNFTITKTELPALIRDIHAALASVDGVAVPSQPAAVAPASAAVAPAPAAVEERSSAPPVAPDTVVTADFRAAAPARVKMVPAAAEAMKKSTLILAKKPVAGVVNARKIWPDQPAETVAKYVAIIQKFGLNCDESGRPIPAKRSDRLISDDGTKVADPITGRWFSMLRHHERLAYGLTHQELLAMYDLTPAQLPITAPNYSLAKAESARMSGLGKRNKAPAARKKAFA
jgi:predicted transcriptional regulator